MFDMIVSRALDAYQHDRDKKALLRFLYLECRCNLSVLDAVVRELDGRPEGLSETEAPALSDSLSTEVLASLFLTGPAPDAALEKLRGLTLSPEDDGPSVGNTLASLLVRTQTVIRLARMAGGGLLRRVDFARRIVNLREDYLKVVKALQDEAW